MEKTYNPKSFETKIYDNWLQRDYFAAHVNKDKTPFTILMPPPNITGQLHIGHALDNTIQDAIIRYKRMKGFEALWLPGTDHASIATEVKIVEKMREEGLTKESVGREEFLRRAFDWKEKYGNRIVEQQYKLGLSCDWKRSAFTMDAARAKAVNEAFLRLYNKGLIYKGDRIINWCPCCKTAISDAEVEFKPSASHLWHVRYPFADGSGYITVATTRPETIPGDTAVAVNPKDERYKNVIGKMLKLPLTDREIPVVADMYVEKDFGSGAVKITPAHDPNDFEVGRRHNLPIIRIMNDDAVLNELSGAYNGMTREEARERIVEDLAAQGFLVKTEDYEHNVGHCYRCGTVIEPIISKQWFVKMKELAAPAIKAVKDGSIKFLPKRFEKMYLHWMENTQDWCISRQLWWGHRIPVYYCEACGKQHASAENISVCPDCGGTLRRDEAVLDTWFSSALWPFSTLGWPDCGADLDYFYPTDVLVTAYDIIGFWVSRMIFSGLEFMDKPPFGDVLIHGIVRDKFGKKMSKSSGNGVDPLELIDKYGADALRFSLVNGVSAGGDIKYSEDKTESCRNFMNKIWNAARFVLLNAENAEIYDIKDKRVKPTFADKWILGRLNTIIAQVTRYMEKYEIGLAAALIYDFVWSEYCDWYIEKAKTSLYGDDDAKRNSTMSVLCYVLREILKLAHPIIPFITAEIYSYLPNKDAEDIMLSTFPVAKRTLYREAVKDMGYVMKLVRDIRNLRREMNVSQSKRTAIYIIPSLGKEKILKKAAPYIEKLASGTCCEIIAHKPEGRTVTLVTDLGEVFIPLGELIDAEKEIARLTKELENVENELARARGKLANAGFVAKAPAALIEAEKNKIEKYEEQKRLLNESINKLSQQ